MSKVHVLSDNVINQIAAGEVIERPASVVKELVENSIDAGATRVEIEYTIGGLGEIRVTDNGAGMESSDLELAFQRHATSKLVQSSDLEQIRTLGFRGEALPSIASVARVECVSRLPDALAGNRLVIEGGERTAFGAAGCPQGTTITVRDLFYNTLPRLKFLSSAQSEAARIHAVAGIIAVGHPGVAVSLSNDGKTVFTTPGNGDPLAAVREVFGDDLAEGLIPFDTPLCGGLLAVKGFISRPAHSRHNRANQLFYINERAVQSRSLTFALEEGYRGALEQHRFPAAILFLDVPTERVDVNVHPAKLEVRLRDERRITGELIEAVRAARQGPHVTPTAVHVEPGPGYTSPAPLSGGDPYRVPATFQEALAVFTPRAEPTPGGAVYTPPVPARVSVPGSVVVHPAAYRYLGQVLKTYLVVEDAQGLLLVDQHAAHERVLFEEYKRQLGDNNASAEMLVPLRLKLPPELVDRWGEAVQLCARLGVTLEEGGPGMVTVRSLPNAYRNRWDAEAVLALIEAALDGQGVDNDAAIATAACHSAIKAGDSLPPGEAAELLDRWKACEYPDTCPHGRPVSLRYDPVALEKLFHRRV